MARSYKFSIIQARPDPMRGERVNVGLLILGPNGVDVRLPEIRKLIHLTGHRWDEIAGAYSGVLSKAGTAASSLSDITSSVGVESEVFALSAPGEISAVAGEDYEDAVRKVLEFFVDKPMLTKKQRQAKINSEISAVLKKGNVLAAKGETIDDGKVVQRYVISEEKDIVADFAYRPNGLRVVSTLDLRGLKTVLHGKACERGATLYFARERFGSQTKTLGVYAASAKEALVHKGEIEILKSFADGRAFNWADPTEQREFKQQLYL